MRASELRWLWGLRRRRASSLARFCGCEEMTSSEKCARENAEEAGRGRERNKHHGEEDEEEKEEEEEVAEEQGIRRW